MTSAPITAALQQLADHHEQLTQLTELITGIGDTLREHAAALAKLAETPPAEADQDRYRPSPPPAWWKLAAADRQEPIARLHAWVVGFPSYRGHIALKEGDDGRDAEEVRSGFQGGRGPDRARDGEADRAGRPRAGDQRGDAGELGER